MTRRPSSCGLRPVLVVALLLVLGFASPVQAAPGDLDLSFGTGGTVTTDGSANFAFDLALQADGKIVVAGWSTHISGNNDFALMRYNTDGSLDTTFGTNGTVTIDFGYHEYARALTLQADGKIVVAGHSYGGGSSDIFDFALARCNTDGGLDTTFGTDGTVTTDFGSYARAQALALQADGKIVVAGGLALARYNTDGSLDTTFGTDGTVSSVFLTGFGNASALALQFDGKIVVAGSAYISGNIDFALARYNTDGSLDTTFGTDGIVTTDVSAGQGGNLGNDEAYALALQVDGKVVVAGYAYETNTWGGPLYDFALARYNTDGSLDTTFGTDGTVTTNIGDDVATALALLADGKIVVAGYSGLNSQGSYNFALARYNTDGSLDTTFGTDGTVTTDFGVGDDRAWALALQADGKIVAAGEAWNGSDSDFALARYQGDEVGPTPSIFSLSPSSGPPGTVVTISGENFGTTQGSSTVQFGSTVAPVSSWSDTVIEATAPCLPDTMSGSVAVTVTTSSGTSNSDHTFTYSALSAPSGFHFPVEGVTNPYTAPIVSVLDHSGACFGKSCKDQKVVAYTGEMGDVNPHCDPFGEACGYQNPNDSDDFIFVVNGAYVGTSADGEMRRRVLNYDGHAGYDYAGIWGEVKIDDQDLIVAAADGCLSIPDYDPLNLNVPSDDPRKYNPLRIVHGGGYETWYLHALEGSERIQAGQPPLLVRTGQWIAQVGSTGVVCSPKPCGDHLHFEVRKDDMMIDPYGWEWGSEADPLTNNSQALVNATPLWQGVERPVAVIYPKRVRAGTFTLRIFGQNFADGALVTVWHRDGQYFVDEWTPTVATSTFLIAQVTIAEPGDYIVKVENPQGPRSKGRSLRVD